MFCRKCGEQIPEDSLFCPKCGERILVSPILQDTVPPISKPEKEPLPVPTESVPEPAPVASVIPVSPTKPGIEPEKERLPDSAVPFNFKERPLFLFKFSGRISRTEFILNILVVSVAQILLFILSAVTKTGSTFSTFAHYGELFSLIPQFALMVRRTRDTVLPLFLIPICFITTMYFGYEATQYDKEALFRTNSIYYSGKYSSRDIPERIRTEVLPYMNKADDYRIAAGCVLLPFLGLLAVLPSRKKLLKQKKSLPQNTNIPLPPPEPLLTKPPKTESLPEKKDVPLEDINKNQETDKTLPLPLIIIIGTLLYLLLIYLVS